MNPSRREFIKTVSAISAGAMVDSNLFSGPITAIAPSQPICIFAKCLQFLDFPKLGEVVARVGFKAAELTVRKGGQVLPENVSTDLPGAIRTLKQSGINVPMIVTGITSPDDPLTENILRVASAQGIGFYRMGYFTYDAGKSVTDNLAMHKTTMEKLEALNKKYGIQGCYQNHSGTNVGGPVWDLHSIVKDCDPRFISVQYDIHHAVAEGGTAWPLGMSLLAPWIKTIAIKDFVWAKANGKWNIKDVPLGEGMVDFNVYFKKYSGLGIAGPITIHYEYDLGGAEHGNKTTAMSLTDISNYLKADLEWLRKKLGEHGLNGSFY